MTTSASNCMADIISRYEQSILEDWQLKQLAALTTRQDLISEADLRQQSAGFLALFIPACGAGSINDITTPEWQMVLEFLADVSRSRALLGFSPSETATMVFSLKQSLFARLRQELRTDVEALADELWNVTVLLDKLGLYTTEVFQKSREDIIKRQQAEQEFQRSEAKFHAIADYTVDMELWFDPDGKLLWVNPSVERITGYSPAEVLARPDYDPTLIAEEDRSLWAATFQEALRGSRGNNLEIRHAHKNGSKIWLGASWQTVFDKEGKSLGVRVTAEQFSISLQHKSMKYN